MVNDESELRASIRMRCKEYLIELVPIKMIALVVQFDFDNIFLYCFAFFQQNLKIIND